MGRPRQFSKKIYCGNCGQWVMTLELESRAGSHANNMKLTYNHEQCGTPGSGVREYGYHDIYPEKQYQNNHVFTVNGVHLDKNVPNTAVVAPLEPK